MNTKVVTDFFGLTSPDDKKPQDDVENSVVEDNEEKVGEDDNNEYMDESDNESDNDTNNESDSDSDDEDLQKLEGYDEKNVLVDYHPEVVQISEEELQALSVIVKDKNGKIIDPLHKTIPIMTKYEKAKIIGIRAQQINNGSQPFIPVDPNMIDGLTIAHEELVKQKIPFIIRRPMSNGASEYWNIKDLEILE